MDYLKKSMLRTYILKRQRITRLNRREQEEDIPARRNGMCEGLEVGVSSHVPGKTENPSWGET